MNNYDKQQDINAAMDSVNLIKEKVLLEKTDENKELVKNNSEHLKIIIKRHSLEGEEAAIFLEIIEQAKEYLQ